MALNYTDNSKVSDIRIVELTTAQHYQNVNGYGSKLPTRYMFRYEGRMRRVYMVIYGNGGSPYIVVKGECLYLDTDTEYDIYDVRDGRARA